MLQKEKLKRHVFETNVFLLRKFWAFFIVYFALCTVQYVQNNNEIVLIRTFNNNL